MTWTLLLVLVGGSCAGLAVRFGDRFWDKVLGIFKWLWWL
jgi:hypothetical protein